MFPSDAVSRVFPLGPFAAQCRSELRLLVPDDIGGRRTVQLPCIMTGIMLVLEGVARIF